MDSKERVEKAWWYGRKEEKKIRTTGQTTARLKDGKWDMLVVKQVKKITSEVARRREGIGLLNEMCTWFGCARKY